MIHPKLIQPHRLAVVGATDNLSAPGGRLLDNLIRHGYKGTIFPVNPKKKRIKGLWSYPSVADIPGELDTVIIAVAAKYAEDIVRQGLEKGARGFIIISAGFSDAGPEGAELEKRIARMIDEAGGTLLGPNNIGLINRHYAAVFTTPVPPLDERGVDLISGSGATAVFIIEAAMQRGMRFHSVWTVGNSAQTGIEEILEYIDRHEDTPPRVIMLYMEHIRNPQKLWRHARSLRRKGFGLAGIKAGNTGAGSRAAASHTGAMATPSVFTEALFEKAGILQARGRFDLIDRAMVMQYPKAGGKRVAVITHAGGPAVMLTDILEEKGMHVPPIRHPKKEELKQLLHPGASVDNPIDILATGTAEQLKAVLEYTDRYFDETDLMAVIFGSPGLFPVYDAYEVIRQKIHESRKPLYPVFPSVINVADEIRDFTSKGGKVFFDEVNFGRALADVYNQLPLFPLEEEKLWTGDGARVEEGTYLPAADAFGLLERYGIPVAPYRILDSRESVADIPSGMYPLVMKADGIVHKTEAGAVRLPVRTPEEAARYFDELSSLKGAKAVLAQSLISGMAELYAGMMSGGKFGKLLMFGLGGTEIELWKDTARVLLPATREELKYHLQKLKIYRLFTGFRHKKISENAWLDILEKIQTLIREHPGMLEMDINPFIVTPEGKPVAVDVRMKVRALSHES